MSFRAPGGAGGEGDGQSEPFASAPAPADLGARLGHPALCHGSGQPTHPWKGF